MVDRIVKIVHKTSNAKREPVVIEWKKEKMMRVHSIRSTVHEVLKMSETLDVVKINIVGDPSTGKTTLAETIAHLCHKMSEKIPYAVKMLGEHDLLNFEDTLKTLTPTNYVIIFDDVSFMGGSAERKQIEKVKQAFTKIRHLEGGQDIKIIAIFNIHYSKALDKYLRMCHFEYFTSIGNSETDNAVQHLGLKYQAKILAFQRIWQMAFGGSGRFKYAIGKKKGFTYQMRQPFAPLLFSNGYSLRNVVFPRRQWIDPICAICSSADKKTTVENAQSIEEFRDQFTKTFSIGNVRQAVRLKLIMMGVNACSRRVQQAMKYLDTYLSLNDFTLEDLAVAYNIKLEQNVRLPTGKKPKEIKRDEE